MKKIIVGSAFVFGFIFMFLLLRGLVSAALTLLTLFCVALVLIRFQAPIKRWLGAKLTEWRSDWKQLGLWVQLAFKRDRDAHATATMAHQQQFLAGRIMSPMNLFGLAALALVASVGAIGIEEWRIGRLKRERDAPCSPRELSLNDRGEYRTTRASCSTLGATLGVAVQWQERAAAIEARRTADLATARADGERALQVERDRRVRVEQSQARQRRRNNEAITAALGGPAPDLERSVCELAGGVACDGAAAGDAGSGAAAGAVPSGSSDAANSGNP